MEFDTTKILICIAIFLFTLYYYLTSTYDYWKSCNVVGPKPIPIFGTIKDYVFSKYSIGGYLRHVYEQFPNEKMIGIYTGREPVLLLTDMELIKTMLIRDFRYFMDRGSGMHEKNEPLTVHLFNLEAKRWGPLRRKLSPVFTGSKLRKMFYLLLECSEKLDAHIEEINKMPVNVRDVASKFMIDVIGISAFGLHANALSDEGSEFLDISKRIFSTGWKNIIKVRLRNYTPRLFDYIGTFFVDHVITNFFHNLTRETVAYRKKNISNNHDFIDLLMALRDEPKKADDIELTDKLMAAQLFIFFVAGFETSSSTTSNCLYELAMNHQVRDKLREEIREELSKTNGAITYDGIKNMRYLDKVVHETLRKYPPVMLIERKTTTPYSFPGTKVSLPVGTHIWIPSFAIQRDPKYFPNPDVFDPERFSEEAVKSRPQMAFLSFGQGPRNCIGARFGKMQVKVALVRILKSYIVDVCEKTDKSYQLNPKSLLLTPLAGIHLKLIKQPIALSQ
nr:cytochrome P450 4AV17 [Meteorus pulchricornis]